MNVTNDSENDEIVREVVMGRTARQVAKSRGMTVAEIHRILDLAAADMFSGEGTRRAILAEAERLGHLKQKLWDQAMTDGESSLHAAALYCKASERLASLLGWNHPQGHVISVIGSVPEVQDSMTSTQRMLEAIKRLRNEHDGDDDEPDKLN